MHFLDVLQFLVPSAHLIPLNLKLATDAVCENEGISVEWPPLASTWSPKLV